MLSFAQLREQNVKRCTTAFGHALNSWSVAEWGNATAGECGEACNIAKKLIRIRDGIQNLSVTSRDEYIKQLADEIADMVIYADLWAASENISLEEAIVKKFNEDSTKRNTSIVL
jgi:NTP pyrophosphatase (non-canonical NTP hydrolase)